MWECLFLLLLSPSIEHILGQDVTSELAEGYCESDNYSEGRNMSGITDCEMNSFSNAEYTGVHGGESRTGLSSTPDSKLMLINSKIRKVASSLSEVNVKGALSRILSSLKATISDTVMSNPSLVAGLRTVERSARNIKTVGELVVFQTRGVTFKLVQDLNAGLVTMRNGLGNNFDQVNQLWQTVKSWLDSGDRQGRFTASSSFRELSAFIRDFHWLRGEERGGKAVFGSPSTICGYGWKENQLMPEARIMGGQVVKEKERFPWQLSLATSWFGFFYQHRCGAAVLSRRWVITAAHCVNQLGIADLYVMGDFLRVENKAETAQIRWVDKAIMHPKFVASLYEQDIALLHLDEDLVFSSSVLPVCLPPPGADTGRFPYLGRLATLTGWGRLWDKGPLADGLEMVQLPLISNDQCMEWYNRSGSRQNIPPSTFLCAGWEEGAKDACGGDSGGPLVFYRPDGRAELVGIVSWGIGCGTKGRPGVYTRVSNFIAWIKEVTGEDLS